MDLLNLFPMADCAHALGALCTFGRGFNGDTWEQDWLLAGLQKSLLRCPSAYSGLRRKGECECVRMFVLGRRKVAPGDLIFLGFAAVP